MGGYCILRGEGRITTIAYHSLEWLDLSAEHLYFFRSIPSILKMFKPLTHSRLQVRRDTTSSASRCHSLAQGQVKS
jgi:hypothetical protein